MALPIVTRYGLMAIHNHQLGDNMKVKLTMISGNRKVGKIPVSTTEEESCPDSCFHRYARDDQGRIEINKQGNKKRGSCYAKSGPLAMVWSRVSKQGDNWDLFCKAVERFPVGQKWRHNQAGDLPKTKQGKIDKRKTRKLSKASIGKRGWTYTHHNPVDNAAIILECNSRDGLTVNLSADNVKQADSYHQLGLGPVVVTLPYDAPWQGNKTPNGLPIVICPAQKVDNMDCATCMLCEKKNRKSIVGFIAHGKSKKRVTA